MPEDGASPNGGWRAVYGAMEVPTSAEASPPDRPPEGDALRPRRDADSARAGREGHARADD